MGSEPVDVMLGGIPSAGSLVSVRVALLHVEASNEDMKSGQPVTDYEIITDLAAAIEDEKEPRWGVLVEINDEQTAVAISMGFDAAHCKLMNNLAQTVLAAYALLLEHGKKAYERELAQGPKAMN